jgi:hypothetical protein
MADDARGAIEEEPPTGSVVAIDWGQPYQEVWVSNRSNIGNWYCPDIRTIKDHPVWGDVLRRAKGRALVLLAPGDRDVYAAGFDAGVRKVGDAVTRAVGETRLYANGSYPDD